MRQLLQVGWTYESYVCPGAIDVTKAAFIHWLISSHHFLYFDFDHIVDKVFKFFLAIIAYQSKSAVQNFLVIVVERYEILFEPTRIHLLRYRLI